MSILLKVSVSKYSRCRLAHEVIVCTYSIGIDPAIFEVGCTTERTTERLTVVQFLDAEKSYTDALALIAVAVEVDGCTTITAGIYCGGVVADGSGARDFIAELIHYDRLLGCLGVDSEHPASLALGSIGFATVGLYTITIVQRVDGFKGKSIGSVALAEGITGFFHSSSDLAYSDGVTLGDQEGDAVLGFSTILGNLGLKYVDIRKTNFSGDYFSRHNFYLLLII
jgi:hypothetical protein